MSARLGARLGVVNAAKALLTEGRGVRPLSDRVIRRFISIEGDLVEFRTRAQPETVATRDWSEQKMTKLDLQCALPTTTDPFASSQTHQVDPHPAKWSIAAIHPNYIDRTRYCHDAF